MWLHGLGIWFLFFFFFMSPFMLLSLFEWRIIRLTPLLVTLVVFFLLFRKIAKRQLPRNSRCATQSWLLVFSFFFFFAVIVWSKYSMLHARVAIEIFSIVNIGASCYIVQPWHKKSFDKKEKKYKRREKRNRRILKPAAYFL